MIQIQAESELPSVVQAPEWWIDKALNDLFFFCKVILHYGKKKEYRDLNWIHRELCDFLDLKKAPYLQKLILMFRDALKSSIGRAFAMQWFLRKCFYKEQGRAFFFCGIADLAEDHVDKIQKELLRNELIQALFGHCIPNKKSDFDYASRKDGLAYRGVIIDIGSPEKSLTGKHYELGINDNLVNELNSRTPDLRKGIIRNWQAQESILAEDAYEIILETTWAIDDLSGHILDPDGNFNYKLLYRNPAYKFMSKTGYMVFSCPALGKDGKPVWPEKVDEAYLKRKRDKQGVYLYNCLYELQPVAEEDIVFRPRWIIHYDKLPQFTYRHMTIDCAGTKAKESSATAIVIGEWASDGKLYISYAEKKKLTPLEVKEWVLDLLYECEQEGRPVRMIGIEAEKYGIFLSDILQADPNVKADVIPLPIHNMPKETRISSLIPLYEGGMVLSKHGLNQYEGELKTYYKGKKDNVDILDAVYYQTMLKMLPPKMKEEEMRDVETIKHEQEFLEQIQKDLMPNPYMQRIASIF